jgi:hypothetical protein
MTLLHRLDEVAQGGALLAAPTFSRGKAGSFGIPRLCASTTGRSYRLTVMLRPLRVI